MDKYYRTPLYYSSTHLHDLADILPCESCKACEKVYLDYFIAKENEDMINKYFDDITYDVPISKYRNTTMYADALVNDGYLKDLFSLTKPDMARSEEAIEMESLVKELKFAKVPRLGRFMATVMTMLFEQILEQHRYVNNHTIHKMGFLCLYCYHHMNEYYKVEEEDMANEIIEKMGAVRYEHVDDIMEEFTDCDYIRNHLFADSVLVILPSKMINKIRSNIMADISNGWAEYDGREMANIICESDGIPSFRIKNPRKYVLERLSNTIDEYIYQSRIRGLAKVYWILGGDDMKTTEDPIIHIYFCARNVYISLSPTFFDNPARRDELWNEIARMYNSLYTTQMNFSENLHIGCIKYKGVEYSSDMEQLFGRYSDEIATSEEWGKALLRPLFVCANGEEARQEMEESITKIERLWKNFHFNYEVNIDESLLGKDVGIIRRLFVLYRRRFPNSHRVHVESKCDVNLENPRLSVMMNGDLNGFIVSLLIPCGRKPETAHIIKEIMTVFEDTKILPVFHKKAVYCECHHDGDEEDDDHIFPIFIQPVKNPMRSLFSLTMDVIHTKLSNSKEVMKETFPARVIQQFNNSL